MRCDGTTFLLALGLAAELVFSKPVRPRSPFIIKESHPVPTKWTEIGPAAADHAIELRIGLKQSQFAELERHLYEGRSEHTSRFLHQLMRRAQYPIPNKLVTGST